MSNYNEVDELGFEDMKNNPEMITDPGFYRSFAEMREKSNEKLTRRRLHTTHRWNGLQLSIENAAGSVRTAKDDSWQTKMRNHYGYVRRTEGADGEHLDCYLGPTKGADSVYIVHQNDPRTGLYDEDKCFLDFASLKDARNAFLVHRSDGDKALGPITTMSVVDFKRALKDGGGKLHFKKSSVTLGGPGSGGAREGAGRPPGPQSAKERLDAANARYEQATKDMVESKYSPKSMKAVREADKELKAAVQAHTTASQQKEPVPAKQVDTPPPANDPHINQVAQNMKGAIERLEFAPKTSVTFYKLRQAPEFAGISKEDFDRAAFKLQSDGTHQLMGSSFSYTRPDGSNNPQAKDDVYDPTGRHNSGENGYAGYSAIVRR